MVPSIRRWRSHLAGVVLGVACQVNGGPAGAQSTGVDYAGARVAAVQRNSTREVDLGTELTLDSRTVVVREGDNLKAILQREGIRADGEALALVRHMNPQLTQLDKLQVGEALTIPTVSALAVMNRRDVSFVVIVEPERREALAEVTNAIKESAPDVISASQAGAIARLTRSLNDIRSSLDVFSRAAIPLTGEALAQVTAEGEALNRVLIAAAEMGRNLTSAEEAVLEAVRSDYEAKRSVVEGALGLDVEIEVVTRDGNQPRCNLAVYIAPLALPERRRRLTIPSSPATDKQVTVADYKLWAENQNAEVVSDTLSPVKVRPDANGKYSTVLFVRSSETCPP